MHRYWIRRTVNHITDIKIRKTIMNSIIPFRDITFKGQCHEMNIKFRKKLEYISFLLIFFHLYCGENGIGDR
jgi:hypothetical protein